MDLSAISRTNATQIVATLDPVSQAQSAKGNQSAQPARSILPALQVSVLMEFVPIIALWEEKATERTVRIRPNVQRDVAIMMCAKSWACAKDWSKMASTATLTTLL